MSQQFYQIGILFTDGWKNALDFVTSRLFALVGHSTALYLVVNLVVLASILLAARFIDSEHRLTRYTWVLVLAESALYAFLAAALSTPLGALLSFPLIGIITRSALGILLALSAGALVYVGASHLLPQVERENKRYSLLALAAGVLVAAIIVLSGV